MLAPSPRIPVIDADALRSPRRSDLIAFARQVGSAARTIGFFAVADHGVSSDLIGAAFAQSRRFFAQSLTAKSTVGMERSAAYRGYSRFGAERLDPDRPGDAKESFNLGTEVAPDDPDILAGTPFIGLNQWPDLDGFRATMLDYFAAMRALSLALMRAFALDLGLADEHYFATCFDRPLATLRLLRYPPHPGAFDGTLFGAAPHTDYGILTLLAQDDAAGLELCSREGTWIPIEPMPGTLICNIGDALMRWSNDVYVSTPHRVVNASGRERHSIAFFADPNPDARIACFPSCATPTRPAKYPPIDYAAYQRERYDATYGPA